MKADPSLLGLSPSLSTGEKLYRTSTYSHGGYHTVALFLCLSECFVAFVKGTVA
jgi:hypothetical protein